MYHFDELTEAIRAYLQQQTAAVGEYEVIQALDERGAFAPAEAFTASLQLFHKHFVTMHCLYRLQQQLYPQRLDITPLSIRLYPPTASAAEGFAVSDEIGALRSYYLDLGNLMEASEDSVADLLKQFWQRFNAHTQADHAFSVLGLSPSATWEEVKVAYRQQVQHAHPDKGGSAASFAQTHEAYQTLKKRFQ